MTKATMMGGLALLVLVLCIINGPLIVIWALNGVLPFDIAYSIRSWFSIVILLGIWAGFSQRWNW